MTAAYIEELLKTYSGIKQVWLIGSRANGLAEPPSGWDYVIMADQSTLDALSEATRFKDPTIDLLVVYDGDHFRKPWPDGSGDAHGSLTDWGWTETSANGEATYQATKPLNDGHFSTWMKPGLAARMFPPCPLL
jgi:hypothetical protein